MSILRSPNFFGYVTLGIVLVTSLYIEVTNGFKALHRVQHYSGKILELVALATLSLVLFVAGILATIHYGGVWILRLVPRLYEWNYHRKYGWEGMKKRASRKKWWAGKRESCKQLYKMLMRRTRRFFVHRRKLIQIRYLRLFRAIKRLYHRHVHERFQLAWIKLKNWQKARSQNMSTWSKMSIVLTVGILSVCAFVIWAVNSVGSSVPLWALVVLVAVAGIFILWFTLKPGQLPQVNGQQPAVAGTGNTPTPTSGWRRTLGDMKEKVSGGSMAQKKIGIAILSILCMHALLAVLLWSTYFGWWSNPAFIKLNLAIIPIIGLVWVLLGEGMVFWLGFVGAGVWFVANTGIWSSKNPDSRLASGSQGVAQNVSLGEKFEGNPRDYWTNGRDRDSILALLSSTEEDSMLAEIAIVESEGNQYTDSSRTSAIQGKVDPDDTGALQINRRIHRETLDSLSQTADSTTYNIETLEGNLSFGKLLRDRKIAQGKTSFERFEDWNASACRWRDHLKSCTGVGTPNTVIASSSSLPQVRFVRLAGDSTLAGPFVVGNPEVYTFNLEPSRPVRYIFVYPDGRERELRDGPGMNVYTGKVERFWIRVVDGRDVDFKFSLSRLN